MRLLREDGTEVTEEVQRYQRGVLRLPICVRFAEQLEEGKVADLLLAQPIEPDAETKVFQCSLETDNGSAIVFYSGVGFTYLRAPADETERLVIVVCAVPGPGEDARREVLMGAGVDLMDKLGIPTERRSFEYAGGAGPNGAKA